MKSGPTRRIVATLLFVALLPGCAAWRVEANSSPRQLIFYDSPDRVRVHLRDDSVPHVIIKPSIAGDRVLGFAACRRASAGCYGPPVSLALDDIRYVEVEYMHPARTVGAIVGFTALIGSMVALVAVSQL